MAGKRKFTVEQVSKALIKTEGRRSHAARLLNCTPQTVIAYIKDYPEIKKNLDTILEENLDMVESKLIEMAKSGNLRAAIFYLRYQGKDRGYGNSGRQRTKVEAPAQNEPLSIDVSMKELKDTREAMLEYLKEIKQLEKREEEFEKEMEKEFEEQEKVFNEKLKAERAKRLKAEKELEQLKAAMMGNGKNGKIKRVRLSLN